MKKRWKRNQKKIVVFSLMVLLFIVVVACAKETGGQTWNESGQDIETQTTEELEQEAETQTTEELEQEVETQTTKELEQEAETQTTEELEQEVETQTTEESEQETETQMTEQEPAMPTDGQAVENLSLDEYIAGMTLREKVCQMLFVTPESLTGVSPVTAAGNTTKAALEKYPVGGIVYSKPNMLNGEQVKEMIANTQSYSKIGLFISADEEGGTVNRLMKTLGTTYIGSMYDYKDQGTETAYQNAFTIATDMSSYGFNLDFAPVADVWSNPDNTVIGKRAYSDNYEQAAELVGAAVKGFHEGGVMCTLKHFPGHGDTVEDSHYASAYVYKSKEEIYSQELIPFASGIAAGAEFVMTAHVIVGDIDENPATISSVIIQDILRKDLGFRGIIITDSLAMSALSGHYSVEDVAVKTVLAGNDMLLGPVNVERTVNALENAVEQGIITEERIDESVRRILEKKIEKDIFILE